MRKAFHVFLAVTTVSACAPPAGDERIGRAEARIVLPKGAEALSTYDRYYAIMGDSARGVFIRSRNGVGKIKIIEDEKDLPFVIDGGCDVVRVHLDLSSGVWKHIMCHGP